MSAKDILFDARYQLGLRGVEPWADALRRFERDALPLPEVPTQGDEMERIKQFLRALSDRQLDALQRLYHDLGWRPEPMNGHGDLPGCGCTLCDPLGEQRRRLYHPNDPS